MTANIVFLSIILAAFGLSVLLVHFGLPGASFWAKGAVYFLGTFVGICCAFVWLSTRYSN